MNFPGLESAGAESSAPQHNPNTMVLNTQILSQTQDEPVQQAVEDCSWRSYYEDPSCKDR